VVLALVVVLAGAARTVTRVPDWRDTDTIMSALIETHPESGTGWLALGRRLTSQGRPEEALRAFAYSLAFLNSEYRPSTQVAAHLLSLGRVDSARFFLLRAWREHPEFYTAPGLLAAAELNAGRPERAAAAARAATILEPADPSMHLLLAQALSGLGDWPEAAAARRAAIDNGFRARGGTWLQLAQDHMNGGDLVAAGEALDSASLRPLSESERSTLADLRSSLALETR